MEKKWIEMFKKEKKETDKKIRKLEEEIKILKNAEKDKVNREEWEGMEKRKIKGRL